MFWWFRRLTGPPILRSARAPEDVLGRLEACGIRLNDRYSYDSIFVTQDCEPDQRGRRNFERSGNVLDLLMRMGDERWEPGTCEDLPRASVDIWHCDYERIENHGDYKIIVDT